MSRSVCAGTLLAIALGVAACVTTDAKPETPTPPTSRRATAEPDAKANPKPTLDDGLTVVARPSAGDPIVNLRVVFTSGSRHDPVGKEGATALTALLMREATTSLDAAGLKAALFPWAAELSVQVDKETTVFIGRVHRDHFDAYLPVFLDVIRAPRLSPEDFARVRDDLKSDLERRLRTSSDELLVREALESALYDRALATPTTASATAGAGIGIGPGLQIRHPYRHPPQGTVAGLEALTLDDVVAHRARVFTRDRALVGISGGIDDDDVRALRGGLAGLPAEAAATPALPPPPRALRAEALLIETPARSSAIALGFPIEVVRGHDDYAALKLAEAWFGEHRNRVGWLFNAMREQRGLNYGDYAYVEHFVQSGYSRMEQLNIGRRQQYFSIWIRPVEEHNAHFAIKQAAFELDRFVTRGVPDEAELERIQAFLRGYQQSKEQEPMRRLGYLLDDAFYGLDEGARDALKVRMQSLTLAEVNAAVARHLAGRALQLVVTTPNAAALKEALVQNASPTITYPAPKDAAVLDEDAAIAAYDLALAEDAVSIVTPADLFAR